ncbi:MAG: hypothetical protein WCV58_01280 [Patescibacteria group bacterium]|jgi:hypothetical protein
MDIKKTLLEVISGTGEAGKTVVSASHDIIKEGAATVGDLVHISFEIAKETGKDATGLVKDVVVGAVSAVLVTTAATEGGVANVVTEAEKAAGDITEEGGEAVRKGVDEAKKIIQEPFK